MKNLVKKSSKIDNSVNNQKSKNPKSNFSKTWKEKRYNMLDITSQKVLLLLFDIIINILGTRASNLRHFLVWGNLRQV